MQAASKWLVPIKENVNESEITKKENVNGWSCAKKNSKKLKLQPEIMEESIAGSETACI